MVHQRKVAVVVDSSSCLPPSCLQEWSIYTVPHLLILHDKAYRDGIDISPTAFYQLIEQHRERPSTAAPPPEAFLEVFREARSTANDLVCITVAANLSSAYSFASTAAQMAKAEGDGDIMVVDSKAAAGAHGLIALEAAFRAKGGADLQGILGAVNQLIPKVNLLALVDTLDYLKKGGRVPKVAAWAGSILGIKPIAELTLGEAKAVSKPRSRSGGIEKLVGLAGSRVGQRIVHMNVMHANAPEDATYLCSQLSLRLNCANLMVSEFTPVMGAHLGPGVVGLAFFSENESSAESQGPSEFDATRG